MFQDGKVQQKKKMTYDEKKKFAVCTHPHTHVTNAISQTPWKSIKILISCKIVSHSSPSSICDTKIITSPSEIPNAFENHFSKKALIIQSSIKYSEKKSHEFLPPLNINSFFIISAPAYLNKYCCV